MTSVLLVYYSVYSVRPVDLDPAGRSGNPAFPPFAGLLNNWNQPPLTHHRAPSNDISGYLCLSVFVIIILTYTSHYRTLKTSSSSSAVVSWLVLSKPGGPVWQDNQQAGHDSTCRLGRTGQYGRGTPRMCSSVLLRG